MNTSDRAIADREEPGSSNEPDVPLEPTVSCASEVESSDCDPLWLQQHLEAAIPCLSRPVRRVAVRVVDDSTMTDMHLRYHEDPTTTDVLTFEATSHPEDLEVDIAVCIDEARRNATERGHDLNRELLLYAIHGLLHCCGFDDHEPADHARMHAEEDRILATIGVGPVFGGEA